MNCQNKSGSTALHVASRYHQLEVIWALLAAGVDKKIKDDLGYFAYDIAYKLQSRGMFCNAQGRACMIALHPRFVCYDSLKTEEVEILKEMN